MAAASLEGKKIVLTGEPGFIGREAAEAALRALGAQVTGSVSGKTDLLIVGKDPGRTKLAKAEELGIAKVGADGLKLLLDGATLESVLANEAVASHKTAADAVGSARGATKGGKGVAKTEAPAAKGEPKKRGASFREPALLAKIEKLLGDYKAEKAVQEIRSRVPEAELGGWLWSVYGRGLLPDHWAMNDLLVGSVRSAPWETVSAALASESALGAGPTFLPGVPARSQRILQSACGADMGPHLREHLAEAPRHLQLGVWGALGAHGADVPPEVRAEVLSLLPDHVLSGRMEGLELGQVCGWFKLAPQELYSAIAGRLGEVKQIHLLTFGVVLFQMPKDELLPILDRLVIADIQPSWIEWWVGRRREAVDSPRDNLAVFEALRGLLQKAADWQRTSCLDRVALNVAKAQIEAGESLPDWLLEVETDQTDFADRWMPVYRTLPVERVRALRDKLLGSLVGYRKAYVMPLAALLGEEEVRAAIAQTEHAISTGTSVTNQETGLLGAIGGPVVKPLAARIGELLPALPRGVNAYGHEYKKFAVVAGLRSALMIALGKVAAAGEPIDEAMDEHLLPTDQLYWQHHDDHVCRFLSSDTHQARALFGALPEDRVQRFARAWLEYDRSGRHNIEARLRHLIPEERHALLEQLPSQVERLRKLAADTGLPCSLSIYALTKEERRREGALNTIGASPLGLEADGAWPLAREERMEAVLSLDLKEIPELQARWPVARALCFFVDRPDHGFEDSALVPMTEAQCAAGFSKEGSTFTVEEIRVPPEVFGPEEGRSEALETLRDGIAVLEARALGAPFLIQDAWACESSEGFVLEAGESFTGLNLGDVGALYVFEREAFWQSH